jgi:hypothetical protein
LKDTVAIVGSHPGTSKHFDFDRTDCDIWVFNEALTSADWCRKATGVFQLHKPLIWRSATNRNDPEHYKWLKEQNDVAIFMQDKYEDVPKSERYPLTELFQKFPTARRYLTSSVAYAIALAVYKEYRMIEVWGVEMETNSEYGHQRNGVAYWVGFAEGRGIYVEFHSLKFFAEPLYGYEGEVAIPLEHYEQRLASVLPHIQGSQETLGKSKALALNLLDEFVKSYKTDMSHLDEYVLASGENANLNGMFEGSKMINEHYLHKCLEMKKESGGQYLIVRQEFESEAQGAAKRIPKATHMLQIAGNSLKAKREELNTEANKETREKLVAEFKELFDSYIFAAHDLGKLEGVRRENVMIMQKFDKLLASLGATQEEVQALTERVEVVV